MIGSTKLGILSVKKGLSLIFNTLIFDNNCAEDPSLSIAVTKNSVSPIEE